MTELRVRALRDDDEPQAVAAHTEMRDEFTFLLGYHPVLTWAEYLKILESERMGQNLPSGIVPATFLVGEVAGEIVGRVSIRHRLNEELSKVGGHIGYAVRPGHRRRGYATQLLRHGLGIAASLGIEHALLTCDDTNTASAKIIESAGGRWESTIAVDDGAQQIRRYWIDTRRFG